MRRLLFIPAVLLAGLLVACSDDDENGSDTPPTNTPIPTSAAGETPDPAELPQGLQFVLDSAADGAVIIEDMRQHLSDELQARSDEELSDAVVCFPSDVNAEVLDQEVTESGNNATLVETWQVTEEGASAIETEVEREWTFELIEEEGAEGSIITGLPSECPFQSSDPGGTQEPAIETPTP